MSRPALIFDIDGTLWDSREIVARGWNHHLAKIGREDLFVNKDSLKSLFGKTMTEIADIAFASIPMPERYEVLQICMEEEHRFLEEDPCNIGYPLVKETLTKLAEKHRLFIVSNSQSGYPQLCIEKLGLEALIQGHLCFGDTGTSKGQTILRRMREHNITSCAYIGDTQGDREACLEAGVPFIFAAYGRGQADGWDAKIDAFADLLTM